MNGAVAIEVVPQAFTNLIPELDLGSIAECADCELTGFARVIRRY
jgi:hypothetical protein